jgi:hypothetical protein
MTPWWPRASTWSSLSPSDHRGRPQPAVARARLDLILGGHEHERHDSVVWTASSKADATADGPPSRCGRQGDWREAVGLVKMDNRLPDDTGCGSGGRAVGGQPASAPGRKRSQGYSVPIDARDDRPEEGVHAGDLVTDAMRRHRRRCRPARAGTFAGRRDPASPLTNYQLNPSSCSRTRRGSLPYHSPGPGCARCWSTASRTARSARRLSQVPSLSFTFDPRHRPASGWRATINTSGPRSGPGTRSGCDSRTPPASMVTATTSRKRRRRAWTAPRPHAQPIS